MKKEDRMVKLYLDNKAFQELVYKNIGAGLSTLEDNQLSLDHIARVKETLKQTGCFYRFTIQTEKGFHAELFYRPKPIVRLWSVMKNKSKKYILDNILHADLSVVRI